MTSQDEQSSQDLSYTSPYRRHIPKPESDNSRIQTVDWNQSFQTSTEQDVTERELFIEPAGQKKPSSYASGSLSFRNFGTFCRIWWPEMLSIFVSIASFILILVVLDGYDNKSLPNWPFEITLNTFLAFFTTLTKGAFMFPVSTVISHVKFSWFVKERALHDFHLIDQASKSWWGSLRLLLHVRFKYIAIGALLMIVSVVSSPVTQLTISYPVRYDRTDGEEATTLAINRVDMPLRELERGTYRAAVKAMMRDFGDFETPIDPRKASCSTGQCTFQPYESMGICVKLANITSQLKTEVFSNRTRAGNPEDPTIIPGKPAWNVTLPGYTGLLHQYSLGVKAGELRGLDTFGFRDDQDLLTSRLKSLFLIFSSPKPSNQTKYNSDGEIAGESVAHTKFTHEAWEILFHMCVQTYSTTVRRGVEETRVVGTLARPDDASRGLFLDTDCPPVPAYNQSGCGSKSSTLNRTAYLMSSKPDAAKKFSVSFRSMWTIAMAVGEALSGSAVMAYTSEAEATLTYKVTTGVTSRVLLQDVLYTTENMFNTSRRNLYLNTLYLDIATSLSSMLQTTHLQENGTGAFNVTGESFKEVSYVHITWGWITLLAVELLVAILFLGITIITQMMAAAEHSRKGSYFPVDAKDSSLATLVLLSQGCRDALGGGLQPMENLEKASKHLRVKLCGDKLAIVKDDQ